MIETKERSSVARDNAISSLEFKRMALANPEAWIPVKLPLGTHGLKKDWADLEVTYRRTEKCKNSFANRFHLRLTNELMDKLGWKFKDRVVIMHHPDDVLCFMAIRTNQLDGMKITTYQAKTNAGSIIVPWSHDLITFEVTKQSKKLDYMIHNNALIFKIG